MRRIIIAVLPLLVFLQSFGRCDGEVFSVLKDPRTGVVLPLQHTPVGVEQQHLSVTLVRREEFPEDPFAGYVSFEYHVQSTYWLYNPEEKKQVLKVAFPIPNEVVLRKPPVLLDGAMVKWQLLTPFDFLELHRIEMRKVFSEMLKKHKALNAILQETFREMKAIPNKESLEDGVVAPGYPEFPWTRTKAFQVYKEQLQRELGFKPWRPTDFQPFWRAYLDLKGKWRCSIWELAWIVYKYANYRPPLLSEWAVFDWFLAPATGRIIRRPKEEVERWMPEWKKQFNLNLPIFELHLRPKTRHQLSIRYQQPAGISYFHGAYEGFAVHGFHFVHVLRVRRSWAFFGPIDVKVCVPKYFQIRSFPPLKFAGLSNGQRLYTGTLLPYRHNLYIVSGTPEVFLPRVILKTADGRQLEEFVGRHFNSPYVYVRLQEALKRLAHSFKLMWDAKTQTATVYCGKEKHATITVNQKNFAFARQKG
ncbi:MAG: hypothetical protein RMK89_01140 [Armatimonadota bacterium]|nr:hypothetical protein [Armatimonadota bacterium]MDW8142042.1 hypothetical protein [Armatimonadota bacterium]